MTELLQAFLRRYARGQAAAVLPYLRGAPVLDLGAGEDYVAAALRREGAAWTCSVDVGPFRRAAGAYVTYDGARLPFRDGSFETTLLLLMLHHAVAPEAVLEEALRVTRRRLIVMESVYRSRCERFWLDLLDGRFNARRHGGRMATPRLFRRPEEWRHLFESRGLTVRATRCLGPRWERLIHHPLLFVLDREPAAAPVVACRAS